MHATRGGSPLHNEASSATWKEDVPPMPPTRIPVVAVDTTEFFTDLTLSKSAWSQMRVWA